MLIWLGQVRAAQAGLKAVPWLLLVLLAVTLAEEEQEVMGISITNLKNMAPGVLAAPVTSACPGLLAMLVQ